MHQSFLSSPCDYSFLYFCRFTGSDEELLQLASFITALSAKGCSFGFDRCLWSGLSSGQMPSQLYTFNFYSSSNGCSVDENILVIFSKTKIDSLPEYLQAVNSLSLESELLNEEDMAESFEEDDEFENCLYMSFLLWDYFDEELPVIDNIKNIWFQAGNKFVQLLLGKAVYIQDEWVESYFSGESFTKKKVQSVAHLLLPCLDKLNTLEEAVRDKERIHLDPEIKGIYC